MVKVPEKQIIMCFSYNSVIVSKKSDNSIEINFLAYQPWIWVFIHPESDRGLKQVTVMMVVFQYDVPEVNRDTMYYCILEWCLKKNLINRYDKRLLDDEILIFISIYIMVIILLQQGFVTDTPTHIQSVWVVC